MKELKSKKSGRIDVLSDEDYAEMVENDKDRPDSNKLLPRFTVTDLRMKPIIPSMREKVPNEIKITKKVKNEG